MKRIRRRTRNRIIGISSTLVVLALGVLVVSSFIKAGYYDAIEDFLGSDQEFGIYTNYLDQHGDIESNFAAGVYNSNNAAADIGNTISDSKANAAGRNIVGEITGWSYNDYKNLTPEQIKQRYDQRDIIKMRNGAIADYNPKYKTEIANKIAAIKTKGNEIVKKCNVILPESVSNHEVIDFSGKIKAKVTTVTTTEVPYTTMVPVQPTVSGGAVTYEEKQLTKEVTEEKTEIKEIDAPDVIYATGLDKLLRSADSVHIKKKAGQVVFINNDTSGEVTIPRYVVDIVGGSGKKDEEIGSRIIWNLPNATEVNHNSDTNQMTILAPSAEVKLNTTGEGWVICDKLWNGAEWHNISRHVPTPTPKVTATPEVTPVNPIIEYPIEVTKAFVGNWPEGAEFKFDISLEKNKSDGNDKCIDYSDLKSVILTKDNATKSMGTIKFDLSKFTGYTSGYYNEKEVKGRKYGKVDCCQYMFRVTEDSTHNPVPGVEYDTTPRHIKIWVNVEKDDSGKVVDFWIEPKEKTGDDPKVDCVPRNGATKFTNKVITTTEPPQTTAPATTAPATTAPATTAPATTAPATTAPATTAPATTAPATTAPATTAPATTAPATTAPVVTTAPPVTTAPVVTTQPPVNTPPTNTPPTTYTNPPSNTPPIVYYTFSPAPTETPTTIVEEEVPLSDFTPEEKPKEETTTIVEDVPLAATVPETGDTMNPMVPIAGMGLSLLAMLGVVVIRKKKFTK